MKIEKIKVSDLKPYENNAKIHTHEQVEQIKKSIQEFGFNDPIAVDENNMIVEGHGRLMAVKALGYTEVDCIRLDGMTDEQKRAYIHVHNQLTLNTGFDLGILEAELKSIESIDMEVFGFDMDFDIDTDFDFEATEDDFEADVPEEPKAKLGDIYQLGRHRLMCGDSTDKETVAKLMNGIKADLVMTDPPYGINAEKMTMGTGKRDFHRGEDWDSQRPDISIAFELAPLICIWGGNYFADKLPVTNDWLIWHKKNDGLSFSECELAWTNFGINCRHISHHWGNEKKQHITMKPLAVIAWAIERTKEKADVVVDLFGGSGTTLLACEQLHRACYMMELDPKYVDVIISRWEQLTGEKAVLLNGKR